MSLRLAGSWARASVPLSQLISAACSLGGGLNSAWLLPPFLSCRSGFGFTVLILPSMLLHRSPSQPTWRAVCSCRPPPLRRFSLLVWDQSEGDEGCTHRMCSPPLNACASRPIRITCESLISEHFKAGLCFDIRWALPLSKARGQSCLQCVTLLLHVWCAGFSSVRLGRLLENLTLMFSLKVNLFSRDRAAGQCSDLPMDLWCPPLSCHHAIKRTMCWDYSKCLGYASAESHLL